jgi:hypothetical protein
VHVSFLNQQKTFSTHIALSCGAHDGGSSRCTLSHPLTCLILMPPFLFCSLGSSCMLCFRNGKHDIRSVEKRDVSERSSQHRDRSMAVVPAFELLFGTSCKKRGRQSAGPLRWST